MATKDGKSLTSAQQTVTNPPPAYRVFISSTYEDMKEYRGAVQDALRNIQAVPMGMERFTASTEPIIERCYDEISQSQFCVCLVGFRYGTLYKDTNRSYSELEFDKAEELGIPVLVFIRKGEIPSDSIDVGNYTRLVQFKNKLKNSATNRLAVSFTSPDDLRDKVTRSLREEFERKSDKSGKSKDGEKSSSEIDYLQGAAIYKNFIRIPAWYADMEVRLRVRIDGKFGSWKLREEFFDAFGFKRGDALYLNDVFVLGADYGDIDEDAKTIDMFAGNGAAEWILKNNITLGDIIEGDFLLAFEVVRSITSRGNMAADALIAKLIFLNTDSKKLVSRGTQSRIFIPNHA